MDTINLQGLAIGRRAPNVRARLLAASKKLFVERGFENVGVRDIAKEAGVFPVEVYRLGLDKVALLALIAIELGDEQLASLEKFLHDSPPEGTLFEKVKTYLLRLYELDIANLPIRSQAAAYGWLWGQRHEEAIILQVSRFLGPIERWMHDEGLSDIRDRCRLIWSLYYVGFRAAVVHGQCARKCLDGIERPLAIALR